MTNSELAELLAAAKDVPLYYDDDPDNRAIKARQRLAAQALALAQEVLDLRGAGGALAEMAEYIVAPVRSQHMRDTTDDCDDARCIACDELADWDEALARWAELQPGALPPTAQGETEVRDGVLSAADRKRWRLLPSLLDALEEARCERDEAQAEAVRLHEALREWAPILEAAKHQDGKWQRPMPSLPSHEGVYVWALKAQEELGEMSAALLGRFIGKEGRGDPLAECYETIAVLLRVAAALEPHA